jgi:hypothetical protein
MFLCHFPSSTTDESIEEAWALPSTLSGGARTFLPPDYSGRRSPGLLNPLYGTLAYGGGGVKISVSREAVTDQSVGVPLVAPAKAGAQERKSSNTNDSM